MDDSMRAIFEENTSASAAQIGRAEEIAERTGESLGAVLKMLGAITNEERLRCLAIRQGLEYVSLAEHPPAAELVRLVPAAELRRFRAVPVRVQLTLALANPLDAMSPEVIEQIAMAVGYPVSVAVASEREIEAVLASIADPEPMDEAPTDMDAATAAEPEPAPDPAPVEEPVVAEVEAEAAEAARPDPPDEPEEIAEPAEAVEVEEEPPAVAGPVEDAVPLDEEAPVEAEAVEAEDVPALEGEVAIPLTPHDQRLVDAIRAERELGDDAVARALESSQTLGDDIGRGLVRTRAIGEADRVRAEGRVWGFEYIDLSDFTPDPAALAAVSPEQLARCCALPVRLDESTLWVAAADPLDLDAIDSLAVTTGRQVRAYIAGEADIRRILASVAPAP